MYKEHAKQEFDVEFNFSETEQESMLKLDDQMNRISMFISFLKQYMIDYNNKCNRLNSGIDEKFNEMQEELNQRKLCVKQSLLAIQKNKQLQIVSELKSLTKYQKILQQKSSTIGSFVQETKRKNTDVDEREQAIVSILADKSENDSAFEIYDNKFDIVSHFQMVITRPAISFGTHAAKDDKNTNPYAMVDESKNNYNNNSASVKQIDSFLDSIRNFGTVEEQPMREFNELWNDTPVEYAHVQQMHQIVSNKVQRAQSVYEHAKTNITNLRMRDLNDLYANNNASEDIVLVFEALHIILERVTECQWNAWISNFSHSKKRKQRWNSLKSILIEPTFVPHIYNYSHTKLTVRQKNILTNNYLQNPAFKFKSVNKQNKAVGQLCHWIVSLVRLANFKKQLQSLTDDLNEQQRNFEADQKSRKKQLQKKQKQLKKHQKMSVGSK